VRHVTRHGVYYRVCDALPAWPNSLDTTFSKRIGGRWNPPEAFGVLYLNATIAVAAANARKNYESEIATLYDLRPERRPHLQLVEVSPFRFIDVVTRQGVRALRLPAAFPYGVPWPPCQRIGLRAYAIRSERGIACRSNADVTPTSNVGEELAIFDRALQSVLRGIRVPFAEWYPPAALKPTWTIAPLATPV